MSGILGQTDLSATTATTVYTVPTDNVTTLSITICNRNSTSVSIRLALVNGTIGNESYIEYDKNICANNSPEWSGLVLGSGQYVVVYSDTANVSVNVYGWEESE